MNFDKLKQSFGNVTSLKSAVEQINKGQGSNNVKDKRYWQFEFNKENTAEAVIRFLPPVAEDGEDASPAVKIVSYSWKNEKLNRWYVNDSPRTLQMPDPMFDFNNQLYEQGLGAQYRIKQRRQYISNILVVNDFNHPENNGKVFLWRYPETVFKMLIKAAGIKDEKEQDKGSRAWADEDDEVIDPFNPFSPFDGAEFRLRIYKENNQARYDKCKLGKRGPIAENDEAIMDILNKTMSIKKEIAPEKFKTYEELKADLDYVLGKNGQRSVTIETSEQIVADTSKPRPTPEELQAFSATTETNDETSSINETKSDDSESISYFSADELKDFDIEEFTKTMQ